MVPGETTYIPVYVTLNGNPVSGLTGAAFSISAILNGAAVAISVLSAFESPTVPGEYQLRFALPTTAGHLSVFPRSTGRVVSPDALHAEIENYDQDALAARITVPSARATDPSTQFTSLPLTIVAKRYSPITITLASEIDFSTWNNFRFSVRDRLHADALYSLAVTTPAAPVNGVTTFTFAIPEDATLFSTVDAAIAAGTMPLVKEYDLIGDAGAVAARTQNAVSGTLTIVSYVGNP